MQMYSLKHCDTIGTSCLISRQGVPEHFYVPLVLLSNYFLNTSHYWDTQFYNLMHGLKHCNIIGTLGLISVIDEPIFILVLVQETKLIEHQYFTNCHDHKEQQKLLLLVVVVSPKKVPILGPSQSSCLSQLPHLFHREER